MINLILSALLSGATLVAQFPSTDVATMHSLPGESMDAFAYRIAPTLADYTSKNGTEACAMIGQNADGYSVSITSSNLHVACIVAYMEKGYTSTGITIHSHPRGRIVPSPLDDKYMIAVDGRVTRQFPDRCNFSDDDMANDGYLVACGRVKFHKGNEIRIISIDTESK